MLTERKFNMLILKIQHANLQEIQHDNWQEIQNADRKYNMLTGNSMC